MKQFTDADIRFLMETGCVKRITEKALYFTRDFKEKMYASWLNDPSSRTIENCFAEHGILDIIGKSYARTQHKDFTRRKKKENTAGSDPCHSSASSKGQKNKEKALKSSTGEDKDSKTGREKGSSRAIYSKAVIAKYEGHPFVRKISEVYLAFFPSFYDLCSDCIEENSLESLLLAFEIDPEDISQAVRYQIKYRLKHWEKTDSELPEDSEKLVRILWNYLEIVSSNTKNMMESIRQSVPGMNQAERKALCERIASLPVNLKYGRTRAYYMKSLGISSTNYYAILGNENYGEGDKRRASKEQDELELINEVIAYKGVDKGSRQVYMQMEQVTGKKMGLHKIQRLMKKYGLTCKIRAPKQGVKELRELIQKNTKSNLLKRRFRLFRPDQLRLTDVTYLDYAGGKRRAYGSAVLDPVTGVLIAFNVSRHNDLDLALDSLLLTSKYSNTEGILFHSDQGSLYISERFQEKVRSLGMIQSMSKRGCCLDNAMIEGYFSQLKCELDYASCNNFAELKEKLAMYADYYNNDRHMWNRGKMTPVQYKKYLEGIEYDPVQWEWYMALHTVRYEEMKETAAARARDHARTLGVDGITIEGETEHE